MGIVKLNDKLKKINAKLSAAALTSTIKRKRRLRKTVHFFKQHCLTQNRSPKYLRKTIFKASVKDALALIKYPLTTEYAMKQIEDENTLVFIVDKLATKKIIEEAIRTQYDVKISKCNTMIRPDGLKKAYVKLSPDCDALDVANKIGII